MAEERPRGYAYMAPNPQDHQSQDPSLLGTLIEAQREMRQQINDLANKMEARFNESAAKLQSMEVSLARVETKSENGKQSNELARWFVTLMVAILAAVLGWYAKR